MRLLHVLFAWSLIYLFVAPSAVYGYLDPATGSMVLQVTIGGLLAAAAFVRMYWSKLCSLFRRRRKPE